MSDEILSPTPPDPDVFCVVCNGQLFPREVLFCKEQATKYNREIEFVHAACFSTSMRQKLAQSDIVISREELDRINAANKLLISVSPDIRLDRKDAEVLAELFIKGLPFETYSRMLARMETVCSVWSAAALKFRRSVGIVTDEEKEQIEQARKKRHNAQTKELLNEADAKRAEGNILTPATAKKKARRLMSLEDKAIQSLMNIGLSEEDARAKVEEQKAKRKPNG